MNLKDKTTQPLCRWPRKPPCTVGPRHTKRKQVSINSWPKAGQVCVFFCVLDVCGYFSRFPALWREAELFWHNHRGEDGQTSSNGTQNTNYLLTHSLCLSASVFLRPTASGWYVGEQWNLLRRTGRGYQGTLSTYIYLHEILYLFLDAECLIRPAQCLNVYTVLMFY